MRENILNAGFSSAGEFWPGVEFTPVTLMVYVFDVLRFPCEAVTVKSAPLVSFGVPLSSPVDALSFSHDGKLVADHVIGVVPVAVSFA